MWHTVSHDLVIYQSRSYEYGISPRPAQPFSLEGVDGNIHTNWLGYLRLYCTLVRS